MQVEVLERICELTSRRYPGPEALSERAAVSRLLRGHTPYDGTGCLTRVAPFRKDLVSLPESVESCPPFEDVAPPEVQRFLKEHPERILRADCPGTSVTPYFDPALKRSAKTYRHFIADLNRRGLPRWTRRPRCQVGLFFVEKDNGKRLRHILDARPANELFVAPPRGRPPERRGPQPDRVRAARGRGSAWPGGPGAAEGHGAPHRPR